MLGPVALQEAKMLAAKSFAIGISSVTLVLIATASLFASEFNVGPSGRTEVIPSLL